MSQLESKFLEFYPDAHKVTATSFFDKPVEYLARDIESAVKTALALNDNYAVMIEPLDDRQYFIKTGK